MNTWACVSNADSGDLSLLQLDTASGALSLQQTLPLGGTLMPMALLPGGRGLVVSRRSAPHAAIACRIDAASGRLDAAGEAGLPASMASIAVDRSGRWLFAASYGEHCISVSPIDADGLPQPAVQQLATPPHAHCVAVAPSNRHLLVPCLGGEVVLQFHFDAPSGRLTPNEVPAFATPAGCGPRHLRFHPSGRFAYLLGELDASISVLAFDAERGTLSALQTLSTLPPGFAGKPWAADLQLTPDGRFLATSERTSSTLAAFAVDPASGLLSARGHVATEAQPRGIAIEPGGRWLLAAGQRSDHVSTHEITADGRLLAARSRCAVGRNPNWIETWTLA